MNPGMTWSSSRPMPFGCTAGPVFVLVRKSAEGTGSSSTASDLLCEQAQVIVICACVSVCVHCPKQRLLSLWDYFELFELHCESALALASSLPTLHSTAHHRPAGSILSVVAWMLGDTGVL